MLAFANAHDAPIDPQVPGVTMVMTAGRHETLVPALYGVAASGVAAAVMTFDAFGSQQQADAVGREGGRLE
jgi:hypothetical protein